MAGTTYGSGRWIYHTAVPMTRLQAWICLGLLIGFVAANQVFWSLTDEAPTPQGDSYTYLGNLLRLLDELRPGGSWDLATSLRRLSVAGRPPLYQLLTTPFILLFGRSEAAAHSVNVVFIALLAIATYNLGRLARNEKAGLLAAFLVLTYPPVVLLSRMYLPYFASCAWAALSLWLLFEVIDRRSIVMAWLLGLSLAAGLLNHPYFAWTLLGPTVATGVYVLFPSDSERLQRFRDLPAWLGRKCRDRFVLLGLLPAALLAIGPSLLWYLTLGSRGFHQLKQLSRLDVSIGFPDIDTKFWWYALSTPGVISNVLTATLVVGLLMAVFRARPKTTILLITLVTGYIFYSIMPVRVWWYFCCVLPAVAVLSTLWIVDVRKKWPAGALLAVTLLAGSFNYFLVTWGEAHAWAKPIARALGSPISDQKTCNDKRTVAFCPDQVRPQPWPWEKITDLMLADPDCQAKRQCQLLIVGIHGTGKRLVNYMMVRDGHGDRIVAEQLLSSEQRAFDALVLSDFIVYPGGPSFSRHLAAAMDFLRNPPPEFSEAHEKVATFIFPSHRLGRLIKRVKALSLEEVEASRTAFGLPDDDMFQTLATLSRAYAMTGDTAKALELYDMIQNKRTRIGARNFLIRELAALAEQLDARGSRAQAIATYEAVLRLHPRHATARERLRELTE